ERIYLHLFSATGQELAFVKAVQPCDRLSLDRERRALNYLSGGSNSTFRAPRLTGSETSIGSTFPWLTVEPLPQTIRPHNVSAFDTATCVSRHLLDKDSPVWVGDLEELTWWPKLVSIAPVDFVSDLLGLHRDGISVGWAHGDFGAHNVAYGDGALWVFDWESSSPDAPLRTDEWSVRFLRTEPADLLGALYSTDREAFADAMLTVAYQAAIEIRHGPKTVRQWPKIRRDIGL